MLKIEWIRKEYAKNKQSIIMPIQNILIIWKRVSGTNINSSFLISMANMTFLSVQLSISISLLINRKEQKFCPISSRWFFIVKDLLCLARDERPFCRVASPCQAGPRDFFAQIERREPALPLGFTSCNLGLSDTKTASTG